MTDRQLEVLVSDQLVGSLREENNLWRFEYAAQWMESPKGFDLSPAPRYRATCRWRDKSSCAVVLR